MTVAEGSEVRVRGSYAAYEPPMAVQRVPMDWQLKAFENDDVQTPHAGPLTSADRAELAAAATGVTGAR